MNESLNRAFIRAYDKEKSSEARRKSTAQKEQADELAKLIVQFDTATVQIPAPHFLQARKRPDASVLVASPNSPQLADAAMRRHNMRAVQPAGLEASIAQQMMQASDWQSPIDSMMVGFPTPYAPAPTPIPAQAPAPAQDQPVSPASPAPVGVDVATRLDTPPAAAVVVRQPPDVIASPSPAAGGHSEEPAHRVANPLEAPHSATDPGAVRHAIVPETPLRIAVPELAPPAAPALSQSQSNGQPGDNSNSERTSSADPHPRENAPSIMPATSARQERASGIFRLDRPSYYGSNASRQSTETSSVDQDSVAAGEAYDESDEQMSDSEDTLWLERSRIEIETAANGQRSHTNNAATEREQSVALERAAANAKEARAMEEKLRHAKLRVFNPVWEVDNLQWPPVCVELLHRMHASFAHIAENLATACQEGLQIMAVTSPQRGEGSTTVACCLALLAGSHGLNVAIVDGDIEKPTLSYQANLDVDQDWRNALLLDVSLEEVAVHSIDDQVTLVPLLNPISQHEMAPEDQRIVGMMRELSASFDLVILDAGRIDSTRSLLRSLGEQGIISAAVAVVDHRSSTPDLIEDCLRKIRQSGIHSIGLVENFAA